jgi:ATP-binding cassette subfamily B multidrug efflux pump
MSVSGNAFDFHLFKRIFSYVKPYRKKFAVSVCFTFLLAFLSPARILLAQYMIDEYVRKSNLQALLNCTLLMVVLLILEGVFQFAGSYLSASVGQGIVKDIRVILFSHLTKMRLKYFDNTPIGTLVTRVVSDMETIGDMFTDGMIEISGDVLKLTVVVVVMFYINVKITLVILTTIPVLLVATWMFKNAVKSAFQDVRTQVARLNAFVQEHITGMSVVQIFNREDREFEKFKEINVLHRDANIRSVLYYSIFFPVVEILSSIALGLMVWYGGNSVVKHNATPGDLIAFIMLLNLLFRPIRMLADRFNTLQMGMVSAERVFKVLDTRDLVADHGKLKADHIMGEIEFKGVWFSYDDQPVKNWVLKGVSFKVKRGETIAIVGSTGAGKTSIVNLLNRFYEYGKGEIAIDGTSIRDYESGSIRSNVGVVLQDVFLFSDTIANNISLFNPQILRQQIIDAAKAIGVHDFIMKLPGGYDYNVMERGGMLSMGQRQLIAFIRASVFDPKILVLDEATSSIDTESERLIQQAMDKLISNRTSIVIAHRLATVQKANRILVLDHGQVIESGTHQELLKLKGQYKKLYELQLKEDVNTEQV